jgi:hypothetical protein
MTEPLSQLDTTPKPPPNLPPKRKSRGYLNGETVRAITFGVITLCIVVSVISCVMGIWDMAKDGVLWRTAATCIVIAGGMMAFAVINSLFGPRD